MTSPASAGRRGRESIISAVIERRAVCIRRWIRLVCSSQVLPLHDPRSRIDKQQACFGSPPGRRTQSALTKVEADVIDKTPGTWVV